MPGLGQDAMRIVGSQIVNDGGHFIAVGNYESVTRAEIIVHIDDQQAVVCTATHDSCPGWETNYLQPSYEINSDLASCVQWQALFALLGTAP